MGKTKPHEPPPPEAFTLRCARQGCQASDVPWYRQHCDRHRQSEQEEFPFAEEMPTAARVETDDGA
jgi:hypothetical protein